MPIKDDSLETYGRKHPVPQNVMDVEFKVVGDLTVRQFMYLIAGSFLLFVIYKSHLPAFWMWIFMFIIASISIAVAFVPIEERGMDIWLSNFVKAMKSPTQRIWKKTETMPTYFLVDYSSAIQSNYTLTPIKNKNKLADFLNQIEEKEQLDTKETERLNQINIALGGTTSSNFVTQKQQQVSEKEKLKEFKKPDKADIIIDEINTKRHITTSLSKPVTNPTIDRPLVNIPSKLKKEIRQKQQIIIKPKPIPIVKQNITTNSKARAIKVVETKETKEKMSNLSKLKVHEIEQDKISLERQVKELKETTRRAKAEFLTKPHNAKHKSNRLEFFNRKLFELKTEREKLDFKINRKHKQKGLKTGGKQLEKLKNQNERLEKELEEIKKDLKQIKSSSSSKMVKPDNSNSSNDIPKGKTNIVSGTVKGTDGKLIESAVIIIKDKNGDIVRVLKTNRLGEFKAQTPIDNGNYTIEVIKSGKIFDIISIELSDTQFEPITLTAK